MAVADDAGGFTVCTRPVAAIACATCAVNDAWIEESIEQGCQAEDVQEQLGAYVFGLAHPAASSQKRLSKSLAFLRRLRQ